MCAQCESGWSDLDGVAATGCEYKFEPPSTETSGPKALGCPDSLPTIFYGCGYFSGCGSDSGYSLAKPDLRSCASPRGGWAPVSLPVGTYPINPKTTDVSSLIVPNGYTVTLYQGGQLVNGALVGPKDTYVTSCSIPCFTNLGGTGKNFNDDTQFIKVEKTGST